MLVAGQRAGEAIAPPPPAAKVAQPGGLLPRLIALLVILAVLILRSPRGLPAVAK